MATIEELLQRANGRQIAGTGLYSRNPQQGQPQQAPEPTPPPTPRGPSVSPGGFLAQAVGEWEAAGGQRALDEQPDASGGGGGSILGDIGDALGTGAAGAMKGLSVGMRYAAAPLTAVTKEANDLLQNIPVAYGEKASTHELADYSFDIGDIWGNIKRGETFKDIIVEPYLGEEGQDAPGWRKSALGFAGEVAADPLTYMSFGATQVAGKGSRITAAARLIHQGQGEDVAARMLKGGSYLTDAERRMIDLPKAGIRWGTGGGNRGLAPIIPGSKRVANRAGKITGGLRNKITTSRPWQTIAHKPEGLERAMKVINSGGKQGDMSLTAALSVKRWDEAYRMAAKTVAGSADQQLKIAFKGMDQQARKTLTHSREAGDVTVLDGLIDDLFKQADAAGIDIGQRANWMPHRWEDGALEAIGQKEVFDAAGKKITIDRTKESGAAIARVFGPGWHTVGKTKVNFGKGTIKEINEALTKAFPDAGRTEWLIDDAADLMAGYVGQVGNDIGIVKAFDDMLAGRAGIANPLDDVSDEVLDMVKTRTANKDRAKALGKTLDVRKEQYKAASAVAATDAEKLQDMLVGLIGKQVDELNLSETDLAARLKSVKGRGHLDQRAAEMGKVLQETREQAEKQLNELEERWYQLIEEEQVAQINFDLSQDKSVQLGIRNAHAAEKIALTQQMEDGLTALESSYKLADYLADMTDTSYQLRKAMDDPDLIHQVAEDMAPLVRHFEEVNLVGKPVMDATSIARDARVKDLNDTLAAMKDSQLIEASVKSVDDAAGAAKTAVTLTKNAEVAATEAAQASARSLGKARYGRKVRNPEGVTNLGARMEAETADELSDVLGGLWDSQNVRRLMTEHSDADRLAWRQGDEMDTILSREQGVVQREVDDVAADLSVASDRAKNLRAKPAQAGSAAPSDRAAAERVAGRMGVPADDSVAAQRIINEGIDAQTRKMAGLFDKQFKLLDDLAKQKRAVAAARQSKPLANAPTPPKPVPNKAGIDVPMRSGPPMKVGQARTNIHDVGSDMQRVRQAAVDVDAGQRQIDEVLERLPEAEQAHLRDLQQLGRLKRQRVAAESTLDAIEARQAKLARLSPERQAAQQGSLAEKRHLQWSRDRLQMNAESMRSYQYDPQTTRTIMMEEWLPRKLDPEGVVRSQLAELPQGTQLQIAELPEAARKAVLTKDERVGNTIAVVRSSKSPVDEAIAEGHIPEEIVNEWNRVKRASGDNQLPGSPEMLEVTEEAVRLGDFITRFNNAVKAGAEPSDELASRVVREVDASRLDKYKERVKTIKEALSSGKHTDETDQVMKKEYQNNIEEVVEQVQEAQDSRKLFARKRGYADDGVRSKAAEDLYETRSRLATEGGEEAQALRADLPTSPEFHDVADTAAGERALWTFMVKQADDQEEFAEEMLDIVLQQYGVPFDLRADVVNVLKVRSLPQYPGPEYYARGPIMGDIVEEAVTDEIPKGYKKWTKLSDGTVEPDETAKRVVNRPKTELTDNAQNLREKWRAKTPGQKAKAKQPVKEQYAAARQKKIDDMYQHASAEVKARLGRQLKSEQAWKQRQITKMEATQKGLGGGHAKNEVTRNWRETLVPGVTGQRGTVASRRTELEEQLTAHGVARDTVKSAFDDIEETRRGTIEQLRQNEKPIAAGEQASDRLDEMARTPGEAVYRNELDSMADVVRVGQETDRITTQHDKVSEVLRTLDDKAADEVDKIVQMDTAHQIAVDGARDDWSDVAVRAKAAKAALKRVKDMSASKADVNKSFEQLDELLKAVPDSPELGPAIALMDQYHAQVKILEQMKVADTIGADVRKVFSQKGKKGLPAAKGGLSKTASENPAETNVFTRLVEDGWEEVSGRMLSEEHRLAIRPEVNRALGELRKFNETDELLRTIDKMTQVFKTWATATPGFHVRNAISATVMNMSDGVGYRAHKQAAEAWQKYKDNPAGYLKGLEESSKKSDRQLFDAFQATFGSGAGAGFSAEELGKEMIHGNIQGRYLHNAWTKKSRGIGQHTEGVVRLAAALDSTVNKGEDVFTAMARVKRLHFDYSDLSKIDKGMKRLVPFWMFMSRNLPLQVQQMAMRPKVYSMYQSALNNFGTGEQPGLPQYHAGNWIGLGSKDGGNFGLTPDMPWKGSPEDMAKLFDFSDTGAQLSALNPVGIKPWEAVRGEKFQYDSPIKGGVPGRMAHAVSGFVPQMGTIDRLTGNAVLPNTVSKGSDKSQMVTAAARLFGIPLQDVTDEQIAKAMFFQKQAEQQEAMAG